MKTITRRERAQVENASERSFAVDTSFVLFFLAVECGRTFLSLRLDNVFMFLTLSVVAVLPYFLASDEKTTLTNWLFGRSLIVALGTLLGAVFNQSLGVVLPEAFRFLPMTLLIVTAMLCCYIQFYDFLKLRLAK